jgi:Protein of unknown function (DUF1571)
MKDAKDCIRPRSTWLLACLGLCLSFLEMGCTGFGGLHSVGTWPPFAHLWARGPGSPSPENDSYAQVMRPTLGLDANPADAERQGQGAARGSKTKGGTDTNSGRSASADRESPMPEQEDGRRGVQVSLGRPEPLPGVLVAASPEKSRSASGGGSSGWRPAGSDRDPGGDSIEPGTVVADAPAERSPDVAGLAPPLDAPPIAPALAASGGVPSHLALAGPSDETELTVPEPVAEEAPASSRADAKVILAKAVAKLATLESYQVKMRRRERVGGVVQPEEDILLSIKRKPKAVRLEWTEGFSKGREVIFSPTLDAKMIYVHQPQTAVVVPSVKIAVDSPLVMKNSRHTIAEAGFETILANLQKSQQDAATARPGAGLDYKGLEKTAGVDQPCHHFIRRTASRETWNIYLDQRSMLPRLVVAENAHGDLLERYVYSDIRENPTDLASAAAFDPTTRWGEGKGLFSRLAKAASGATVPSNDASTKR